MSAHNDHTPEFPSCSLPPTPARPLDPSLDPRRAELIAVFRAKWVNGSRLNYHFLEQAADAQLNAVRQAFSSWKELGIGLSFREVGDAEDAEIRIAFADGGSWSYVGRDALSIQDPRRATMNFGWDLTTPHGQDTTLHEVGHALGFGHEHQSPFTGIVWDEEAVYRYFAAPPNEWKRPKTRRNVLDKYALDSVDGSHWDRDSIMHYRFAAGLIVEPPGYSDTPLIPAPGLSPSDKDEVRRLYPLADDQLTLLEPFSSTVIDLEPGEQLDFAIEPQFSREYTIATFGALDTVMVLFEEIDGDLRFVAGDDDSGTEFNAQIEQRLVRGRRYVLRLRLYYAEHRGQGALMMW